MGNRIGTSELGLTRASMAVSPHSTAGIRSVRHAVRRSPLNWGAKPGFGLIAAANSIMRGASASAARPTANASLPTGRRRIASPPHRRLSPPGPRGRPEAPALPPRARPVRRGRQKRRWTRVRTQEPTSGRGAWRAFWWRSRRRASRAPRLGRRSSTHAGSRPSWRQWTARSVINMRNRLLGLKLAPPSAAIICPHNNCHALYCRNTGIGRLG